MHTKLKKDGKKSYLTILFLIYLKPQQFYAS